MSYGFKKNNKAAAFKRARKTKDKIAEARTGTKRITDGIINKMLKAGGTLPTGWMFGSVKKEKELKVPVDYNVTFTDPVDCKMCKQTFHDLKSYQKHRSLFSQAEVAPCYTPSSMYSRGWALRGGVWMDRIPELTAEKQS